MNKILERFFTGFVGFCVLAIPIICLLAVDHVQRKVVSTQERLEQVSQHLGNVEDRLNNSREIVYQVDSYGGTWHGKITDKEIKNNRYGVEVGNYGWFMVTKEQYEALNIGDDAPEELKERGN